jgi:hypothetical protein
MNINEDEIFCDKYPDFADENLALACLLADDVCFLHNVKTKEGDTVGVSVNCSDVMAWGCSDAESILSNDNSPNSEIISLYKLWKKNKSFGSVKWVCLKRNQQPQAPLKKMMIEKGAWDEELEALPPNQYDIRIKEYWAKKKNKNDN